MPNNNVLKKIEVMLFDGDINQKKQALKKLIETNTLECHNIIKKALREGDDELKYFIKKEFSNFYKKDNFSDTIKKTVKEKDQKINLNKLKKYLINEDPRKRLRAVEIAAKIGDIKALPLILNMIESENDDFVKATIAKNLGLFKDESLIPVIAKFFDDRDSRVRANAIEGLELIGSEKIIEFITPLLRDRNNRVQANAAKVIARFDIENVIEVLEKMLTSPAIWQRESALYALKELKNPATVKLLSEIVLNDTDTSIRLNALKIISGFSESISNNIFENLLQNNNVKSDKELKNFIEKKLGFSEEEENNKNQKNGMSFGIKISLAVVSVFVLVLLTWGGMKFNEMNFNRNKIETVSKNIIGNKENNIKNSKKNKKDFSKKKVSDTSNRVINDRKKTIDKNQKTENINLVNDKKDNNLNNLKNDTDVSEKTENSSIEKDDLLDIFSDEVGESSSKDKKIIADNLKEKSIGKDLDSENSDDKNLNTQIDNTEIKTETDNKIENDEEQSKDIKVAVSQETNNSKENEKVSINKLNRMLDEIDSIKEAKNQKNTELNILKDKKEEVVKNENLIKPSNFIKNTVRKKIAILPAIVKGSTNYFDIFSNGLLFSVHHIIEPVGSQLVFTDPEDIVNVYNKYATTTQDILNSKIIRDKIFSDLNIDNLIIIRIKEGGSYFYNYWEKYIDQNALETASLDLKNDSFLLARIDPSVDVTSMEFKDEVDIEEREKIAQPFYVKGLEYFNKKDYKNAYNEFKVAYNIAPDSIIYRSESYLEMSKNSYMLAMSRDEENLVEKIRFNIDVNILDKNGVKKLNKSYNANAKDFYYFYQNIFKDIKNAFDTDGLLYSDYNTVNGHTKDFKATIYMYKALEYMYSEKPVFENSYLKNKKEKIDKARNELKASEENSKDFSLINILNSKLDLMENKVFESIKNLKKAIEKEPERLSLKYKIALYEEKNGNHEEALKIYDEISSYKNLSVYKKIQSDSIYKVVISLIHNKEFEKALNKSEHGMKISYTENLHLAKMYCEFVLKDFSKALQEANVLETVVGNDLYVKYIKASSLYSLNSKQKALEEFKYIISNISEVENSIFNSMELFKIRKEDIFLKMGNLYKSLTNNNLAISYYKQTISVSPYSEEARQARRFIEEMEYK